MKRKYAPYISILIGIIVIGLYLYSTYTHNEYIKNEQQRIFQERNEARENANQFIILIIVTEEELDSQISLELGLPKYELVKMRCLIEISKVSKRYIDRQVYTSVFGILD